MRFPLSILLAASLASASAEPQGHVFAWPFMEWEEMKPRGGTTEGAEVTLASEPGERWKKLREPGITKRERDRRAILALAGSYRVSFDFIETLGFSADYRPPRPYFSWGTEHVEVLEDRGDFISLQHTLVMYFKNEEGETEGPHVMKHWRQDWTFEDKEILAYLGDLTWARMPAPRPGGRWSQAVFQVDDSPRYEVMGRWAHRGGMSVWRSDNAPRPLPRREFSVRDDYNILEGHHEITIAPNGWLHVQHNRKLSKTKERTRYVGTEIGVNRYEAITAPELAGPVREDWEKTGGYWKNVRDAWAEVLHEQPRIVLEPEVDGQKLWQIHFGWAAEIAKREEPAPEEDAAHARETVRRFLKQP